MQDLQERVAELEAQLRREQDRSRLLESDLARLRLQTQWASGSSGGSTPRLPSPSRLTSPDAAALEGLSPFAAAAGTGGAVPGNTHLPPPAAAAAAAAAGPAAAPADPVPAAGGGGGASSASASPPANDTVVVSRAALELLYLKERAMDAAHEGIVIADCSLPDMPLIVRAAAAAAAPAAATPLAAAPAPAAPAGSCACCGDGGSAVLWVCVPTWGQRLGAGAGAGAPDRGGLAAVRSCSPFVFPFLQYANEGFTRMTGYSRADVLGRNCR